MVHFNSDFFTIVTTFIQSNLSQYFECETKKHLYEQAQKAMYGIIKKLENLTYH